MERFDQRDSGVTAEPARRSAGGSRVLPLFRLWGVEVQLSYTWFFIFGLILIGLSTGYFPRSHPDFSPAAYWTAGFVSTLLFFASIVLHELSHAWMARREGIPVPAITLFLFGGVSHLADEPADPGSEVKIAIVGPLTSFALGGLFWSLHAAIGTSVPSLVAGILLYLAFINMALGVFNLLPGLPLDGGRILRALAWSRTGSIERGTRVAATAGKGIAFGLMILGGLEIFAGALVGGFWLILIGLFLRATAEAGYQSLVILESLADVDVDEVSIKNPETVSPGISLQQLLDRHILPTGYRSFPVVDGETVVGLVSIDALRGLDVGEREHREVRSAMTPISEELCVRPGLPLADAMKKLVASASGRLLLIEGGIEGGRLRGMLTKEGLSRFLEIREVLEQGGRNDERSSPSAARAGSASRVASRDDADSDDEAAA